MRFSIITITYNSEKYLQETLNSVFYQNFTDYEHILWDGGSTDKTLTIARSFPQVHIFEGNDSGISDAMNKGAALAKGEFLLHLHSDDLLEHSNILSQVDNFLRQHPSAQWTYGKSRIIDESGHSQYVSKHIPFSHKKLRKYNIISHPSTFIYRELFKYSGGFNTQLKFCMDYELWLRLAKHSSALAMPFVTSRFREHHHSTSTTNQISVAHEAYQVRNQHCQNLWERWKSYQTWKKRLNNLNP